MSSDDSTTEVTDYGIDDKGSIPGKGRDSFFTATSEYSFVFGGGGVLSSSNFIEEA
jgi:hypothetical protein